MTASSAGKTVNGQKAAYQRSAPASSRVRKKALGKKALGKTIRGRSVRGVQRRKILAVSALSLAKVAFLFYVTILIVFLIAGAVIWNFAGVSGLIIKLNHFIDQLIGSSTYHVSGTTLLIVVGSIGVVWTLVATIVTLVCAMLFNLAAEYVGGISVLVGLDDTNI
ncbi:MAG: DUF3566 domain-containing protein [Actinomycetota bacterium]|jgi:hypothetical protein|nr:DUF3566 domain-containing protein [Actinomycetota bacterium]